STATTTVTAAGADLSITKTAPATVPTGQALTYTLSVHNAGPSDATGVAVTDTLPTGVTFASGSAGCVNNSGTVTCKIGNLANGANASATIAVTAPSTTGPISNSATVSGSPADTNTGDNTASASTNVVATKTITVHNTAELQNVFGKNDIAPAACDTSRPPNLCPSAGDTILLASNNYFPTASLDVTISNLTIIGPGTAPGTQVSGSGIATASALSGNPDIFVVAPGVTATFRNLFLTQTQGGNSALNNLGGTAPGTPNGGPVVVDQLLIATNTLANGVATGANSFTTVQNTTLNANQVGLSVTDPSATVSLNNVTISSNPGGGIGNVNGGNVSLTNTILALNTPAGGCATAGASGVASLDKTGAGRRCGGGIHSTTNPLGGQADNGGPTATRSISATGPAFNVGTGAAGSATCPAVDQRGFARETGRNCDLGAYGVIRADLAVTKTGPATATL